MKTQPFAHLHLHTAYSLLDGACRIDNLMDQVAEQHMPAVAMTDHGVMYGAVEFYKAASERGIRPILGCEAYITNGSRFERTIKGPQHRTHHIVLLARNNKGYSNLCRLVSSGHLEGFYYKPRIDKALLAEHHEGLIALSACLNGEIYSHLREDDMEGAVEAAGEYVDILGRENFYIEVMDHGIPAERRANRHMNELARRMDLSLVATNDVHYLKKEHAAAHELMLCLQTGTVMSDPKRMRYSTNEFYLKTYDEMVRLFAEFPGAVDRTMEIAERCEVEMEFGKLHFPTYGVPEGFNQKEYLIHQSYLGISKNYNIADPAHPTDERERGIMARFDHELDVIERTGFVNYFLVVWDFIRYALEHNIAVGPGRGSGGGSIVAYALGIIAIDPLKYHLIFERFLNPERVSPPDFDIDFCQERRGEVIDYVKRKYGSDHVAQIITFGSLGAKTVIRDVGRALEVPFARCNELAKMIPDDPKMTLKLAQEMSPEFKAASRSDEDLKRILEHATVLEGLYRNPGTHAAGVVIGEKPLIDILPLAVDKEKQLVTQYAKEPVEEVGLLKMDFLGLRTLTVIQEAVRLVKECRGIDIDIAAIDYEDAPTYELLSRADTVGVFQLESGGMRDLIRQIGLSNIEEVIALIALYRPGPMNMLPDYIDRKCGKARIVYDHPKLEPILKDTYGVMVYQEQVQQAANVLAGYSLGEADILRRAMGKKKAQVMEAERQKFVSGCKKTNNMSPKLSGKIFDNIAKFAGYGFNKAHSAGYAIVCYQTAYLKANFPAEFMCGLISSEIGNFDKLPIFVDEAVAMGMEMRPPDINASHVRFRPEDGGIRFGLAGIKNVGAGAAEALVRERGANGPFSGLVDLCSRVDSQLLNKKILESLARSGAMDALGDNRARLFEGVDFAMTRAASAIQDQRSGQGSLFDLMEDGAADSVQSSDDLPEVPAWPESELLASEHELLGIYMSGHPLSRHARLLERYQLTTVKGLTALQEGTLTRLGGIVSSLQKRVTKASKASMAVIRLEDLDGSVEVVVFPDAFAQYGVALEPQAAIMVCGKVMAREGEEPRLSAAEIYTLADVPKLFTKRVSVHLSVARLTDERLDRVRELLRTHPGPVKVMICLQYPTGEKVFVSTDSTFTVLPDDDLIQSLEQELGEASVFVAVNPDPCRTDQSERRRPWRGAP